MSEFQVINRLKESRHGKMLYNIHDVYIGRSFDIYGEFSQLEVVLFEQMVVAGDIVIDVGANIGAHTLYFAKAVGPTGAVLAFEPQRIVFQTLCANMALNSVTNVHCFQQGLAEKPGSLNTVPVSYGSQNNFGGLALGNYAGGEVVEVGRLDRFNLPRCKLLKVDVEGMELQVLKGATGLIEKHKPILYVENDRPQNSDALIAFIDSLGYRMYWHRPGLFNPDNFLHNPNNVFGNIVSLNLLCLHGSMQQKVDGMQPVEIRRAP